MNRFIAFSALLAVAAGAPASDADAAIHILGRAPITSVGGLTTYANGAVVPTDTPAVAAATAQHLAAKGTPILADALVGHVGYAGYGYAGYPYAHYIGKREADSDADILIPGRAPITSVGAFTTYANGAVVPTDTPAVAAATSAHLAARGTPALHTGYVHGYAGWPYGHFLGKREAESDPAIHVLGRAPITSVGAFTTYANGAVVPTDTPAVAAATAQHLAAKGTPILHDTYAHVAHVGYAGYPFAHYGHYLGKREAESDAEAYYGVYGLGYGYGLHHVPAVTSVGGLTTYSNGAVVPTDPANLAATSAHLAGKGLHYIGKREAEPYYGIYGAYPVTSSVITSINPALTTYANGAVVPTDPNNLAATSAHLAEKAHRIGLLG
jgi:hypothetical protein